MNEQEYQEITKRLLDDGVPIERATKQYIDNLILTKKKEEESKLEAHKKLIGQKSQDITRMNRKGRLAYIREQKRKNKKK